MPEKAEADKLRDTEISVQEYQIINFKPTENQGYLEHVRTLVEIIEQDMERIDSNPREVAIEIKVDSIEDRIPF